MDRAARNWLFRHTKIIAVIDLPRDSFEPYTGTTTSLVMLERTDMEPSENYDIFMAISREIGHDKRGMPKYKTNNHGIPIIDKDGQMVINIDSNNIIDDYRKFINGKLKNMNQSFVVKYDEVKSKDRLDATAFNPNAYEAHNHLKKHLPEGWSMKTVGEVTEKIFYPNIFKRAYVEKKYGVPFISGANITRLKKVGVKYLSKKTKNLQNYFVKRGWILVTRSGTSGIVVYADKSLDGIAVSEHVIRVVPDCDNIDSGYLYAMLSSPILEPIFKSGITGSVVDEITPDFISNLRIPVPDDSKTQREIGKHIFNAEQKISEAMELFNEAKVVLNSHINTE